MSDYFDELFNTEDEENIKKTVVVSDESAGEKEEPKDPSEGIVENGADKTAADEKTQTGSMNSQKRKGSIRTGVVLAAVIILFPVVVLVSRMLGDTKYYIGSCLLMILAMLPFFVSFENRKPQARELVTLAVMTALAIVSRLVFIWLPWVTPMAGMIVITAVAFGCEAGFMCGALAIIVSNIVCGQGPWTPWQMFCFALIGLLAGLMAGRRIIGADRPLRSAVITFIITFILSGLILDTCTIFLSMNYMYEGEPLAIYLAGLPVNAVSGAASAAAVFFLIKPITEKTDRIKMKYGL